MQYPIGPCRGVGVVGYHDHGLATVTTEGLQQIEDLGLNVVVLGELPGGYHAAMHEGPVSDDGEIDTGAHLAGEPEGVARRVLAAIDRGKPVVYAPGIWAAVMFVIRNLPRFAMRRIGF